MRKIIPLFIAIAIIVLMPAIASAESCTIRFDNGSLYVTKADNNYITGTVSPLDSQYVVLYKANGKAYSYEQVGADGKFALPTPSLSKGENIFYIKSLKTANTEGSKAYKVKLNFQPYYTIVFKPNGGTGEMENQQIVVDKKTRLRKNTFTRDGYEFVGWCTKSGKQVMKGTDVTKFKNVNMEHFQLGKVRYKNRAKVKNLSKTGRKIVLYAVWKGSGPQAAVDWACLIADDNHFAYGTGRQAHSFGCYYCGDSASKKGGKRYLKTYCCNPFISAAYTHGANHKNGKCLHGNMSVSSWARYNNNHGKFKALNVSQSELKPGDIFFSGYHVWMYRGDGKVVQAGAEGWHGGSISKNGGLMWGSKKGMIRYYPSRGN